MFDTIPLFGHLIKSEASPVEGSLVSFDTLPHDSIEGDPDQLTQVLCLFVYPGGLVAITVMR